MPPVKQFDSYLHVPCTSRDRIRLALLSSHYDQRYLTDMARLAIKRFLELPENKAILEQIESKLQTNI